MNKLMGGGGGVLNLVYFCMRSISICDVAGGGARLEEELLSEIAHLRQRISQVEMINTARRRDLALLTQHVNRSLPLSSEFYYYH